MTTNYTLEEVTARRHERAFLNLPKRLYKNCPYWICPLDDDIRAVFDPERNKLFEDGEAVRWIVRDEKGIAVGRIAAFYNRKLAKVSEWQPTGGCGFFESIDNQRVADLLFNAARDWLASKGLEAMDGPINFGNRDMWWGLLTHVFNDRPLHGSPYNFEYYIQLFENYGFRNYFNQYSYLRELKLGIFPENVYERVRRLKEEPAYRFDHIHKKNLKAYADAFLRIYNSSWAEFSGVKPMEEHHARELIRKMKPIIDEKLIYFAFHNDQPIGFFVMIPDINDIIAPFNGNFGLISKLRFLWRLKVCRKARRIIGLVFGVVPEFQGRGIESGMIIDFENELKKMNPIPYDSLELVWVGDFNPLMMRVVERIVVAKQYRTYVTYRYLFDRSAEFHRAPRMGKSSRKAKEST